MLFIFFTTSIVLIPWGLWSWSAKNITGLEQFRPFFFFIGGLAVLQQMVSLFFTPTVGKQLKRDVPVLIVIVPMYNEDPVALKACVQSLFFQSVLPDQIHLVDDGSNKDIDYSDVKDYFFNEGRRLGIFCTWEIQKNGGKRAAQITALKKATEKVGSVIVTMDSDGILAKTALEEGSQPFEDLAVQSVAGLVVSKNVKSGLLSRFTEMIFVTYQQLVDRLCMSVFSSIPVNSGGLSFYRYEIIQEAIEYGYDRETFGSSEVKFSDDSYLTLFALLKGKAIAQPTAVVFADMPVTISHHIRQQLRWARGSFIRGFWRIKYAPINSVVFWRQLIGWLTFSVTTCIFIQIIGSFILSHSTIPLAFF